MATEATGGKGDLLMFVGVLSVEEVDLSMYSGSVSSPKELSNRGSTSEAE